MADEPLTAWEEILAVSIPGDPKPAPRPRRSKNGGVFMPTEYRHHLDALAALMRQARGQWRPERGVSFAVKLLCYRASRTRCDTDNLAKPYLDAGNGVIWTDDSLVDKLAITKLLDRDRPRTELRIWVKQSQAVLAL